MKFKGWVKQSRSVNQKVHFLNTFEQSDANCPVLNRVSPIERPDSAAYPCIAIRTMC